MSLLDELEIGHKENFIKNTLFAEHLNVYNMAFQLVFLRQNTLV